MTALEQHTRRATAEEIRAIIGPSDDDLLTRIVAVGATREEVLEAFTWLGSDDYLHRKLHHSLSGRAALVFDLLEAELVDEDDRR